MQGLPTGAGEMRGTAIRLRTLAAKPGARASASRIWRDQDNHVHHLLGQLDEGILMRKEARQPLVDRSLEHKALKRRDDQRSAAVRRPKIDPCRLNFMNEIERRVATHDEVDIFLMERVDAAGRGATSARFDLAARWCDCRKTQRGMNLTADMVRSRALPRLESGKTRITALFHRRL